MKTLKIGIEIEQNTDFNLIITIKDENGPIDITSYQFKSQMRSTTEDVDPVAEFTFTIQNQTTNKGQVKWSLSAATSADIPLSDATSLIPKRQTTPFLFDVKMKDDVGIISRIVEGIIYISPEATQEAFT